MRILDFLNDKAVSANLTAGDKKGVIVELIKLLMSDSGAKDRESMVKALLERESLGSTGIGQSIAIPHAKSDKVRKMIGAIGISKKGIDFDALDGEPVFIFFLLLAPMDSAGPHLKALARISRLLRNKYFRDSLKNASDEKTLLKIIKQEDEARD
ncbi:MAG: PTS sugar transporter subunit IIA [Candidatus Omnitrophica bacterium]|nr:PTS sugar transporter subunit IIA [Candidatus Omnitrophota bacterium]